MRSGWDEHCDHLMGEASEAENALAWNRMNMAPDDSGKIADLVGSGRFVAVERGTVYCPSTDAIMGSRSFALADFATRAEAESFLAARFPEGEFCDGDVDALVLPPGSAPVAAPPPAGGPDDLPF